MTFREAIDTQKTFVTQRFRRNRAGVLTAAELHKLWDHLPIWGHARRAVAGTSPAEAAWYMEGMRDVLAVVLPELVDGLPGGWRK